MLNSQARFTTEIVGRIGISELGLFGPKTNTETRDGLTDKKNL